MLRSAPPLRVGPVVPVPLWRTSQALGFSMCWNMKLWVVGSAAEGGGGAFVLGNKKSKEKRAWKHIKREKAPCFCSSNFFSSTSSLRNMIMKPSFVTAYQLCINLSVVLLVNNSFLFRSYLLCCLDISKQICLTTSVNDVDSGSDFPLLVSRWVCRLDPDEFVINRCLLSNK